MSTNNFFATCPKGLEGLLEQELQQLGAEQLKQTVAGVYFKGPMQTGYRACLWSRLANRILLLIDKLPVGDARSLYKGIYNIDWSEHLSPIGSLIVDFNGTSATIRHTQFGAQTVKDAIVDQFRSRTGKRPDVIKEQPDVRINVYLEHDNATVSIDLSGESLHRRHYRLAAGAAPMKENLAAAILYRVNWPIIAKDYPVLLDPMCGSATLLIEALMMAADIAPGLLREHFGFTNWLGHYPKIWQTLWQEALQRKETGLQQNLPKFFGYDIDEAVIQLAQQNIAHAGLENYIQVNALPFQEIPTNEINTKGVMITNAPYGERIGQLDELAVLYRELGTWMKNNLSEWQCALLTANPDLGKQMGLRSRKQYAFFNGALPCKLLLFTVTPEWFVDKPPPILN